MLLMFAGPGRYPGGVLPPHRDAVLGGSEDRGGRPPAGRGAHTEAARTVQRPLQTRR